jgi:signal transduction histidine kinase
MVEGSNEVKDLSITLEVMRRNSENSKKNLIQKVKERTKELERANEELRAKETEVNNINIELRKSTRAKEEFLSMVSHELKTPITPMKLYIEMILKEDKSNNLTDFQKKGLNIVYKNIIKLETIINDIFTVYKMESDNFALNKEVISVEELVETNVSALKPLMKDKEIDLNVVVATNSSIYCDPNRISQVLFNLVNNAVDHVPDKNGRITIEVEKQNIIEKSDSVSYGQNGTQDKIVFTIEDNGIGIKKENIPGLFKKFYQIDTGLRRKYGGTGLGLAICKGIIESHGGSIWLDTTYKDGARFKFTLDAF